MEIEPTLIESIESTLIGFKVMENLLPNNILELSISERIQLVQDIWDSVAMNNEEISVTDNQKEELNRRLNLFKQNPDQVAQWKDIKQKLN